VGGPGSGKSTIGSALARRIGSRSWDLDDLALTEGINADLSPRRALADRARDLEQLAARSSWVSEGSYLRWTDVLFERADAIVWLDPPWRLAARRIAIRHVGCYFADIRAARGPGARLRAIRHPHLRFLARFFAWSAHYYKSSALPPADSAPDDMQALTRAATQARLLAHAGKVIHITTPGLQEVLAALAGRTEMYPGGSGTAKMPVRTQAGVQ